MTMVDWRPAGCLGVALVMVMGGEARAQPAAVEAPATAPYQDRVLLDLPPDTPPVNQDMARQLSGWPRMVRLESRWRQDASFAPGKTRQNPYLYGMVETPNFGTFTIDGEIGPGRGIGSMTLRQSDMPLDNGWWASHEAGLIQTPTLPLARTPSRVYVPSAFVRGFRGEWAQRSAEFQAQASVGEPGWIDTTANNEFQGNGSRRVAAGLQWGALTVPASSRETWAAAIQVESGRAMSMGLPGPLSDLSARWRLDADSVFLAARKQAPESRLQVNALSSHTSGEHSNTQGLWLDSSWGTDRRQRSAGLYWLAPGLNWAGLPMPSDMAGVYARRSWQERQWSAEGSIDWLRSIGHPERQGFYATGAARWRVNKLHQIGAGLSERRYGGAGRAGYLDWRWRNRWGLGGVRWDQSRLEAQAKEQQLTFDQDWDVARGWGFTSSVSVARTDGPPQVGAGLNLAVPISTYASARADLNSGMSGPNGRHLNLALGLNWRVTRGWQLDAQYTRYRGQMPQFSLDPLTPPLRTLRLENWSLYVVLRFEWQAGSAMSPLGGRAREGGGRIEGTVYFDANRNGKQDADEAGVPSVQVYLDNRYTVRTDAQGRFEFALVAAGQHTISVRNESLPLPWAIVGDGQARVTVGLRDGQNVDFPVQLTD